MDITCPFCSNEINFNRGDGEGVEDGFNEIACGECGEDISYVTHISYSYRVCSDQVSKSDEAFTAREACLESAGIAT